MFHEIDHLHRGDGIVISEQASNRGNTALSINSPSIKTHIKEGIVIRATNIFMMMNFDEPARVENNINALINARRFEIKK